VLSRADAAALLVEYGRNAAWTAHCRAVAAAAERLGDALAERHPLDRDRLWTTALLHDIGRCVTHDPIGHGAEGYKMLTALGHADEAHVCASHILFGLPAEEAAACGLPRRDFLPRTFTESLVPLVDFMIQHDRAVTLARRFASLRRRNGDHPWFLERLGRAEAAAVDLAGRLDAELGRPVADIVAGR
jgi:putative nucleotidyltransferase with HDIG domain